jgi:hypothetical protein
MCAKPRTTKERTKGTRKGRPKTRTLDSLSSDEAHDVLMMLVKEDASIAARAEELALGVITDVDAEGIANNVLSNLEALEVEDVWDNAGKTRHGYVDPYDLAWEMFEEAIEPIHEEMRRLRKLGRHAEAREFCVGLMRGLWKFENEGGTEFKDWAIDAPENYFKEVLEEWRKSATDKRAVREMDALVAREFPDWTR